MEKIIYFLLFSLSCALLSCSSVDDDEIIQSNKRLVTYKTPADAFEFTYNNEGNTTSYKHLFSDNSISVHANFFYEAGKLAHVKIDGYSYDNAGNGKIAITIDEKIIYHTNDTILIEVTYDKGTQNELNQTDSLIIDPGKEYLLKGHISSSGLKCIYTYDNAGNMLTEEKQGKNFSLDADYTYDSNPSPFKTLKGIPHWYWTYLEYESSSIAMYSGANNRIEEKRTYSHGNSNIENSYSYDTDGYPLKKYYTYNNEANEEEYIYEKF